MASLADILSFLFYDEKGNLVKEMSFEDYKKDEK